MWRMKIRLRHHCLFGENCRKSSAECINVSFNTYKCGKFFHVFHFGTVYGDNYRAFFRLIRRDKRTHFLETEGRTFLVIEKRRRKEIPGMNMTPEIIYTEPVHVFADGYEEWGLASLHKGLLMDFISHARNAKVLLIEQTKLTDIYFPMLSPGLSPHQREALALARRQGYYEFPKKANLDALSRMAKCAKSTFREHLRKAERKVLGTAYAR